MAAKFHALAAEVREDQWLLRDVLGRLAASKRRAAQAAAWVTEKMSEGRPPIAARCRGSWPCSGFLEEIGPDDPPLADLPFAARADRTEAQHAMIEPSGRAAAAGRR
ncbi:MAG: hypothetical protein ACREOQ_21685 [Gemmatimonadales bacterium]